MFPPHSILCSPVYLPCFPVPPSAPQPDSCSNYSHLQSVTSSNQAHCLDFLPPSTWVPLFQSQLVSLSLPWYSSHLSLSLLLGFLMSLHWIYVYALDFVFPVSLDSCFSLKFQTHHISCLLQLGPLNTSWQFCHYANGNFNFICFWGGFVW